MKHAGFALIALVAVAAALTIFFLLSDRTDAPAPELARSTPTERAIAATPTALPRTWADGLRPALAGASPVLVSCFDPEGDGRIVVADRAGGAPTLISLVQGEACHDPANHADYMAVGDAPACSGARPLLIVGIASAGSDLLDATSGESMGLLDIVNELRRLAEERGAPVTVMLAAPAVFGAERPQTSMEHWIAAQAGARLADSPCTRAVFVGHSHGGATVTSATAALDAAYGDRMLAVLIDRTTALYDRPATEMPVRTPMLNFFQLNEGWHGIPLDAPNAVNFDESGERAPVAPSDGGGGFALVSHKTLDDSPGVQRRVIDAIWTWLDRP